MCQRGILQGVGLGLRNNFAEEALFHSETSISQRIVLGYEIISQRMPYFAGGLFWLRNFRKLMNLHAFGLLWFPETFLHHFCNYS